MTYLNAIILGLIEGLSEFLPISSTGHLILASNFMGLPQDSEFLKLFEIFIQTGAILAIIGIYLKDLLADKKWLLNLAIAFVPSGILGLLFYKWIKAHLFTPSVVCASLVVGGIVLIILDRKRTENTTVKKFTMTHLLGVGFFQCLAFVPGVSRSAATILGGELLGLNRLQAVQLSFLLGVPTIFSASALSLIKHKEVITSDQWGLLITGLIFSFCAAFLSVKIFLRFLHKKAFLICGIYRIVLGILYGGIFLF